MGILIIEEDDEWTGLLPLTDEHGYPLLTNAEGNEILDDWGQPIRTGFGDTIMQVIPVD